MGNEVMPRHKARATRVGGQATRQTILAAARGLFTQQGLGAVSVSTIATEAGVFPSQVTYYFGSKEGLFVEVACHGVLEVAARVERAAKKATDIADYAQAVVRAGLAGSELATFAEALLLVRHRPDLAGRIEETLLRLHDGAERAVEEILVKQGWALRTTPAVEARVFWSLLLGLGTQQAAVGAAAVTRSTMESVVALLLNLQQSAD